MTPTRRYSLLGRVVWKVGRFVAPRAYERWRERNERTK